MQINTAGQNTILTGYASSHVKVTGIGEFTDDTSLPCHGLSAKLSEIKNSVTHFFVSVKDKVDNAFHQLSGRINTLSVRQDQSETMQLLLAQETLGSAHNCLSKHVNLLREILSKGESLTANSLVSLSSGSLRSTITQLSAIQHKIAGPGTRDIRLKAAELLSAPVGFGEKAFGNVTQLGSISSVDQAKPYLAQKDFDVCFKAGIEQLIKETEQTILPKLMKLQSADIISPSVMAGAGTGNWQYLSDKQ
ncbi:hypothetical protein [Morganella psychrotolerans]|uniref:hypothetical protein n=1 Tax=Morganella psychrotolerans TaxID=368603 RepID=UPI0039B122F3